jgi:hypothetical protein
MVRVSAPEAGDEGEPPVCPGLHIPPQGEPDQARRGAVGDPVDRPKGGGDVPRAAGMVRPSRQVRRQAEPPLIHPGTCACRAGSACRPIAPGTGLCGSRPGQEPAGRPRGRAASRRGNYHGARPGPHPPAAPDADGPGRPVARSTDSTRPGSAGGRGGTARAVRNSAARGSSSQVIRSGDRGALASTPSRRPRPDSSGWCHEGISVDRARWSTVGGGFPRSMNSRRSAWSRLDSSIVLPCLDRDHRSGAGIGPIAAALGRRGPEILPRAANGPAPQISPYGHVHDRRP